MGVEVDGKYRRKKQDVLAPLTADGEASAGHGKWTEVSVSTSGLVRVRKHR